MIIVEVVLRYRHREELPEEVKDRLPIHAQELYKEKYNEAWFQLHSQSTRRQSETRHELSARLARDAIIKRYPRLSI